MEKQHEAEKPDSGTEQLRQRVVILEQALQDARCQLAAHQHHTERHPHDDDADSQHQHQHPTPHTPDTPDTASTLVALHEVTHLRTIIEHNADAIVVDKDGIVRFVNRAAERLFECSSEEMLGNELGVPFVADEKAEVDIIDRHGARYVAEMRVVDVEWEGEWAQLATFRDITARKQIEEELEHKVEERTTLLHYMMQLLSIQLNEREKAELAILRRDAILEAVGFAAQCFLKTSSFTPELPGILKRIGVATDVCRVALYAALAPEPESETESTTTMPSDRRSHPPQPPPPLPPSRSYRLVESWTRPEACIISSDTDRPFQRWHEQLHEGYPIYGDVRAFPVSERHILEQEQIESLIAVPVFVGQQWWGFLELDACIEERMWSLSEGEALKAAASILGSAIQLEHMQDVLRTGEEQFRTIANFTYDWVYWIDPNGAFVYMSPSCERLTGYPSEAFLHNPALLMSIIHPDDVTAVEQHACQTHTHEAADSFRFRIVTRHGAERWFHHVCQPVYAADGRWLGRRISNRDITEQVSMEEAYRVLVEHSRQGLVIFQDGLIVFANPAVEHILGYATDSLLAMSPDELAAIIHEDDRDSVQQRGIDRIEGRPVPQNNTFRIVRSDGERRWLESTSLLITYRGRPAIQMTYVDVTEQRHIEEALRQSEERFRAFVEGTNDLILQVDPTGQIVYVNHAAQNVYGIPAEACIGRTVFDFVHADDRSRTRMIFHGWVQRQATSATFENRQVNQETGAIRHMHWTINLIYDQHNTLTTVNCMARDISEHKQVEKALREGESRYRAISELISDFAYSLRVEYDGKLFMEWATDAFARTIGYTPEEINAQGGWTRLIYPEDMPTFKQHLDWLYAGQSSVVSELRIVTRQGETLWIRNHCRPVWDSAQRRVGQIFGGARNITDRKKAEEELHKAHEELELRVQERTAELARTNDALQKEIAERTRMEEQLRQAHNELEKRVQERTAELAETNRALHDEVIERKRAEDALRESEARYRLLADSATDMISRHAPNGTYRYVSPACRALLGYAPRRLIGQNLDAYTHPEDRFMVQTSLALVRESLTFNMVSYRIQRMDGSYMWFETSMKAICDPDTGSVQEIIAVSRDITERKQADSLATRGHDIFDHIQELIQESNQLGETTLDTTQHHHIETIRLRAERVLALLAQVLEPADADTDADTRTEPAESYTP